MKKIILIIIATFILSVSIFAQSGSARLKGFVATSIKNGSAIDATVELRAIENNSKTKSVETVQTKGGSYDFEVSFGYYLLTISAKGYETYQTKVYIPSSVTLNWGTILEKSTPKVGKCVSGNCVNGKGKYTLTNEDIYDGNFVKGKFEGQGTYTAKNGEVYVGQFANDKFNGKGKLTLANGDSYTGEFLDARANGFGKQYIKATNTTLEGTWKDGKFVGK